MMEENIIEKVRSFVEEECRKPTSNYGKDPYEFHFVPVTKYAKELAEKLGGDVELVEIAAWLHDVGSIMEGRENHHLNGSKIAEIKLREFGYPEDKILKIKHCIETHRGSQKIESDSIEAKIVREADAMDTFDRIAGLFEVAYVFEKLSREEARKSVKQKFINKWNQLSPEAKELIKPKYEAAMLLLK